MPAGHLPHVAGNGYFEQVTTAIAQFMRELERLWDEHREASVGRRDLAGSLAHLAAQPSVWHLPAMTGAAGRQDLERFYAEDFLPHVPADLAVTRTSRTVDRFHLVDETTVSFTHDRELPWLLPGVDPTHRRAQVQAVAIVGFERGRIRSQRIHWDHATLAAQLGIPIRSSSAASTSRPRTPAREPASPRSTRST